MEEYIVKILEIEQVTHDVKRFRIEKPDGYTFIPGQATDLSVNTPEFSTKKRPFSFTCLTSDPFLEFTIKIYPDRRGVTNELMKLQPGSELIIRDTFGAISYRGKGAFIAGGAGITPFIAIFRHLREINEISGNLLLFANKTKSDIILEDEFREMLGNDFINILSDEKADGYYYGFINEGFLKTTIKDLNTNFYLCGPPRMMDLVLKQLSDLGVGKNAITIEL
jgi:ferredoxin-NADP reductase